MAVSANCLGVRAIDLVVTEARQRIQARGAERRDHDGGAGDSQQKQGHLPDGRRVVGFNAEQQRLEPWQCAGGERQGRADEGFGEQHTANATGEGQPAIPFGFNFPTTMKSKLGVARAAAVKLVGSQQSASLAPWTPAGGKPASPWACQITASRSGLA